MKKSSIFMGTTLLLLTLVLGACTSETEGNQSKTEDPKVEVEVKITGENETSKKQDKEESVEQKTLKIGDTVKLEDGVEITLNSAKEIPGGQFDTIKNDKFLVVDVSIVNNSKEEKIVSSILEYEMKDSDGYGYTTTFVMDGVKSQLDGSVPVGGKLRGQIAYDVPSSDYYEFTYKPVFLGTTSSWKFEESEITK